MDIITEYTGPATRPMVSVAGDVEHMRITKWNDDGTKEVLFAGSHFSEQRLAKHVAEHSTSLLYQHLYGKPTNV